MKYNNFAINFTKDKRNEKRIIEKDYDERPTAVCRLGRTC